jgi:multisubunit Na+/H+ antiporter MnhG subunit
VIALLLCALYAFLFVLLFGVLFGSLAVTLTACWDAWALARADRSAGLERWDA